MCFAWVSPWKRRAVVLRRVLVETTGFDFEGKRSAFLSRSNLDEPPSETPTLKRTATRPAVSRYPLYRRGTTA